MQNKKFAKPKQLYEMTDEKSRAYVSEYLESSRKLLARDMSASIEEVQSQLNGRPTETRISWFRQEISKDPKKVASPLTDIWKSDRDRPTTFSKIELTEMEEIDALLDAQKLQLYAEDYRRTKHGMTLGMSRMSLDAVARLSHFLETETIPRLRRAWDWGGDSGQREQVLSQLRQALRNVYDVRRLRDGEDTT